MSIDINGGEVVNELDAEQTIKNYTPGVQETAQEESPEEVDNSPISDAEREGLDAKDADTFQPLTDDGEVRERVEAFQIPGEWVSPVVRNRRKRAMALPGAASITNLEQRISKVMRFDSAPQAVADAAQEARAAVSAAREAHEAGRHPDSPRYAVSQAAKDAAVQEIAKATAAVSALEQVAAESGDEWFESLVGNLDKQRAEALKALKAASKAYASLRATINGAQALAVEQGRWDRDWHSSAVPEVDLNAPIGAIREAISHLDGGDEYTTGAFLTSEYEGIPPHTLAKLERRADLSDGGSFARQVYARAKSPMANDEAAQDAIAQKRLALLTNSNPLTTDLLGKQD